MFPSLGVFWLWQFFGRLHPLMVHFPVALLIVVLLLELFVRRDKVHLRPFIQMMLTIGAVTAVASAVFGLMLAWGDDYSGDLVVWHKWTGIATASMSVIVAVMHRSMRHKPSGRLRAAYRTVLVVTVLGVAVAGHLGASMTHGPHFLTEVLPWSKNEIPDRNPHFDLTAISAGGEAQTPGEIADLTLEVRAIFAHNCYKCHSAQKSKGDLRLDKKDLIFRGGESGPVVRPGNPDESELLRRVELPRGHDDAMPPKGAGLDEKDIATLTFWIQSGALWADSVEAKSLYRVAALEPRNPEIPPDAPGLQNDIDRFVDAYFAENDIKWKRSVDDRLYIRRVYFDIVGLPPTPEAVTVFLSDPKTDKRERLVRELLDRDDDYAQHWLTFWNDALRNDYTGTGYITGGRSAITPWLYESLRTNKPYDLFVRELIAPPDKRSEGFIRGIEWRGTVNASQRTEMQAAQNVSQIFLGLNLKCASCHDSFISDWTLEEAYAFANIFAEEPLEINRCDKPTGRFANTRVIFTSLGTIDSTLTVEEKSKQLAEYLTAPRNGRLYRTIVNRVWAQMMGRGIVTPVDEMDNVPWSQDLLDWLAWDFEKNGKDLRRLMYLIATSRTYQLPSVELDEESELQEDDFVFRGMIRRRLSAEQFADAVSAIASPIYSDTLLRHNPIKSLALVDRPRFVRAALVRNDPFQTALGRPNRENVSTSRVSHASLLQALELTNGETLARAIHEGAERWRSQYGDGAALVDAVYRQAFGRDPVSEERQAAMDLLGETPDVPEVEDFLWSVVLLPEFQLIF